MKKFISLFCLLGISLVSVSSFAEDGPPNLMVEDKCAEKMMSLLAEGEHSDRPLGCVYEWGEHAQIAVALDKSKEYKPGFAYFKIMMRKEGNAPGQLLQGNMPIEIPVGIGSTYLKKPNMFPAEAFSVDRKKKLLIVMLPAFCGEPKKTVEYRFDEDRGFLVLKAIMREPPPTEPSQKSLACVSNS